jgi:DNA ligase-1
MKPMLAGKLDVEKLTFPVVIQPKLDGIRACVVDGKLVSRSLKPIPNEYIRYVLEQPEYEGLDGELILGDPTAEDCYRQTNSAVMSSDGEPVFTYYVFDLWNHPGTYSVRYVALCNRPLPEQASIVPNYVANSYEALLEVETELIEAGHEGGIVRGPHSLYKFGRGTASKGDLIKLKRFVDSEAEVIGVEEEMHNANEATTNELGRTARSSHKANKIGKGTMGALIVRDLETGVEFAVGTGFTAADRQGIWKMRDAVIGSLLKYKSFPVGVKDKPRHPVFLGWRHPDDL